VLVQMWNSNLAAASVADLVLVRPLIPSFMGWSQGLGNSNPNSPSCASNTGNHREF
jgi:hypothetical protein